MNQKPFYDSENERTRTPSNCVGSLRGGFTKKLEIMKTQNTQTEIFDLLEVETAKNALSKQSETNEIKAYFQKILELKQSGDEFPVNLDEVYPLVYEDRHKAVEFLRKEFNKIKYENKSKHVKKNGRLRNFPKNTRWIFRCKFFANTME